MITKDEQGNEIEVFTKAELDAKVEEATKPLAESLEKQKADLEAAVAAGGTDKDENIKKMREAIALKDEELKKVTSQLTEMPGKIKSELLVETKVEAIAEAVGKDDELKKKVEFFMDQFKKVPTTKAEMKELVDQAYLLATGGERKKPGVFDGGVGSGGYDGGRSGSSAGEKGDYLQNETANAKAIRSAMGISDEEAKKFGKV
jgi:hypothetical protein